MKKLTPKKLGWVAGIIEGEGCFGLVRISYKGKKYVYPKIVVSMTDEDIVNRLHRFTGVGRVCSFQPSAKTTQGLPVRRVWSWQVQKRVEVFELLNQIFPLLGRRRREQALAMLSKATLPVYLKK